MTDHIRMTIEELSRDIRAKEGEIRGMKATVNMLCEKAGVEKMYVISDDSEGTVGSIQPDTFYGQPLNRSVRRVLEMRKAAGLGPATVPEIYDALERGGYQFGASNRDNAIRGLRISLGKSSHTFHKLPGGEYGLLEWYPEVKSQRQAATPERDAGDDDEIDEKEGKSSANESA